MKNNPITAEVTVAYDFDASSRNFEESFKSSPFKNEGLIQYIRSGETPLADKLKDLFTIKNNNKKFLVDWLGWTKDEAGNYDKDDLREEIIDQLNFDDLMLPDDTDGIIIERKFNLYTTRGYSQGDYAQCIVMKDDDFENIQTYIDNIFWDSPIWSRIEIFSECANDITIEGYDIENIPEYPSYKKNIDFINKEILKFVKDKFKYVPALKNIIDAVTSTLPSEIYYPRNC